MLGRPSIERKKARKKNRGESVNTSRIFIKPRLEERRFFFVVHPNFFVTVRQRRRKRGTISKVGGKIELGLSSWRRRGGLKIDFDLL